MVKQRTARVSSNLPLKVEAFLTNITIAFRHDTFTFLPIQIIYYYDFRDYGSRERRRENDDDENDDDDEMMNNERQ